MLTSYNNELEIYIHIPFCVRKCLYCDFLSAPADEKTYRSYVAALKNEIIKRTYKEVWPAEKMPVVPSVFFGGGTPTVLEAEDLSDILALLQEKFNIADDAEITIECNPGTADFDKLSKLRKAGFNRLSIGLQNTDDERLKSLGRIHDFSDFLNIWDAASKAGFENKNVDLITAIPGQKIGDTDKLLKDIKDLNPRPKHISLYSLIIEDGTEFKRLYDAGKLDLPDEDEERAIHWKLIEEFEKAGYTQYELSNFSLPGYECRHNIGYWTGREYLGFGIGAASYFDGKRFADTRSIEEYTEFWASDKKDFYGPLSECNTLSEKDRMEEFMFLGLRMTEGIDKQEFFKRFGRDINSVYRHVIEKHIGEGLLESSEDRLYLTKKGQDLANYVMADMIL